MEEVNTMKKNMGPLDRLLRVVVVAPSAAVAAVLVGLPSVAGFALLGVTVMSLVTAATGVCLLYLPFGIDTHGRFHRIPRHTSARNLQAS
jgi:hypothetical protein